MKLILIKNQTHNLLFKSLNLAFFDLLLQYFKVFINIKRNAIDSWNIKVTRKKKLYTLLKSPHVNKKSRDQFFFQRSFVVFSFCLKINTLFGMFLKTLTTAKGVVFDIRSVYLV